MEVRQVCLEDDVEAIKSIFRTCMLGADAVADAGANDKQNVPAPVKKFINNKIKRQFVSIETIADKYTHENRMSFLVAVINSVIVGMVSIERANEKTCILQHLCVHPSVQKQGIGKSLVDSIIAKAKHLNYEIIELDTIEYMKAAQKLYLNCGFNIISRKVMGKQEKLEYLKFRYILNYYDDIQHSMRCSKELKFLSKSQLFHFLMHGYVVVPNVLNEEEINHILDTALPTTLNRYDVDVNDLASTSKNLSKLSSTNGAGGVLDLFYEDWKLKHTLENKRMFLAMTDLYSCTYGSFNKAANGSSDESLWYHPYEPIDGKAAFAHVDRIGFRLPDRFNCKIQKTSGMSKRQLKNSMIQRSLTPHLDCCPTSMYSGGNKQFPRFRPIQCMLSVSETLEAGQGGFECVPGFHLDFNRYYRQYRQESCDSADAVVCVDDYTHIRPKKDQSILDRMQHVPIPRGAAVFWDQRLPHANARHNNTDHPRVVLYGGYLPRISLNKKYATEQLSRFKQNTIQPDFWIEETKSNACDQSESKLLHQLSPLAHYLLGNTEDFE